MSRTPEQILTLLRQRYAEHFGPGAHGDAHADSLPFVFASAPGRVELAGNHTDHQGGYTLSGAIDQRSWALAALNGTDEIQSFMEGFGKATVSLARLDALDSEHGTSLSLIRGMAAAAARRNVALQGFNMVTCSDIPVGRGVSSSAAFEVLVGTVIDALCDSFQAHAQKPAPQDATALALDAAWAECTYFGKPCGAQDQLASAHGGVVALDFSRELPCVTPVAFDANQHGYTLYLIDSRCDHSLFNDEFASIPADMFAVARYFDCTRLAEVPLPIFLEQLSKLRSRLGDRAVLRALHFFEEAERVLAQQQALQNNDFARFLELVRLSGASSAQFLQNISSHADVARAYQPAAMILALCAHLLDGSQSTASLSARGAYRIHGGGFGGSVLAFVPSEQAETFAASLCTYLNYDACMPLSISSQGATVERFA